MVVALIALTSAILVPALLRVDTGAKVEVANKLADALSELSERSLFLGQITALRVDAHGYTPLYYAISTEKFQPFDVSNLRAQHFDETLSLAWQPDDAALAGQLKSGMSKRQTDTDNDAPPQQQAEASANVELPQIFFLPGGQASSGLLTLTDEDGHNTRLQLDPLGQVTLLDSNAEDANTPELPPLLLPDDASFYQTQAPR